jgi:hypothetical protein
MTEHTTLEDSKGLPLKKLANTVSEKVNDSNISDVVSISERLFLSYIWDRSPPSHRSDAFTKEDLSTLPGDSKEHDMTSYRPDFMYLFEIYSHHLKPLFPALVSADNDTIKERILVGLITPTEKAMLACAAARMYIVNPENTTVDYYAICRHLIYEAKSDMIKERPIGEPPNMHLCFFFSICYLLVPDIQPDNQYLLHCVESLSQVSQPNSNGIVTAEDEVNGEESVITNFWTTYLLCYCKYKYSTFQNVTTFREVEIKPLSLDQKKDKRRMEYCVFLDVLSRLLKLRLTALQQLDSQKPISRERYDRIKLALKRWRNAIPKTYESEYSLIDSFFAKQNQKGVLNSLLSNNGDIDQYPLLTYLVYTGTAILVEEYLHQEEAIKVDTRKLTLATSMVSLLEIALMGKDINQPFFLMTHRLITEDALHALFIILQAATTHLISKGNMDKRLTNIVICASRSVKSFLQTMAFWYKQENLTQLEADVQSRTLLKKIEMLRKTPKYNQYSADPILANPNPTHSHEATGLPAAPSSSVILPAFSAYEVFLGAESSDSASASHYRH